MLKHFTLTTILIANLTLSFAQRNIDFNNYRPLEASGEMPEDFFEYSFEKVERDIDDFEVDGLSSKKKKKFIKGVHYGIDQMLHSGKVLYGDPISEYVSKVGKRLITNRPELSNLRFYTLRSNVVNALSTHQGIIFVTQGLMAQIENESQLAFILAHEIAHYMENHVVQSYVDRVDLSKSRENQENKIKKLSQYSRDKELEADEIGIEIYHNAGYAKEGLYGMFDVMAYSYLPFELKDIPDNYWNTDLLFIPEYLMSNEYPEISTEKDYDDSKSSHPNIKSRSEQIDKKVESLSRWGDINNHYSEEEFKIVQTLSRFESIRNDLANFKYAEALYGIFLLEDDYPDNLYLNRCKAQAWAGLIAGKADGRFTDHVVRPNLVQGPAYKLHFFLRKMTKQQLFTVGLRVIKDLDRQFKSDNEISAIMDYTLEILAGERLFNIERYKEVPFLFAKETIESKSSTDEEINEDEDDDDEDDYYSSDNTNLSKFDRIRSGKSDTATSIKNTDFHLYALSDLVNDSYFLNKLNSFREQDRLEKEEQERLEAMNPILQKKEYERRIEDQLKLGLDNLILLEPQIRKLNLQNKFRPVKTEKLQIKLHEIVEDFESVPELDVHRISRAKYKQQGTIMYNERAALINALMQMAEYPNSKIFPVDYAIYNEIINRYSTTKVAFVLIESQFNNPLNIGNVMYYILFPPYALFDLPMQMTRMFEASFNVLVFDMETFSVNAFAQNNFLGITNKATLHAMLYDLVHSMKQKPSTTNEFRID
jgi:hypothetical protein